MFNIFSLPVHLQIHCSIIDNLACKERQIFYSLYWKKYHCLMLEMIMVLYCYAESVVHALGFSVSNSPLLETGLNTESSTSNRYEIFFPLLVEPHWNLGTQLKTLLDSSRISVFSYIISARTPQKTRVKRQTASSLARYQLWVWRGRHRKWVVYQKFVLAESCLPTCCLAVGVHVTIQVG
jgi:hypothetical protein